MMSLNYFSSTTTIPPTESAQLKSWSIDSLIRRKDLVLSDTKLSLDLFSPYQGCDQTLPRYSESISSSSSAHEEDSSVASTRSNSRANSIASVSSSVLSTSQSSPPSHAPETLGASTFAPSSVGRSARSTQTRDIIHTHDTDSDIDDESQSAHVQRRTSIRSLFARRRSSSSGCSSSATDSIIDSSNSATHHHTATTSTRMTGTQDVMMRHSIYVLPDGQEFPIDGPHAHIDLSLFAEFGMYVSRVKVHRSIDGAEYRRYEVCFDV